MNLAYDITSLCRIRVLLVPISPIKQSVFNKYAQLIKSFYTIRLGDVTPNLNSNDIFNSQVFPEGQLCFDFFTNFTNDHVELQDFEPYRRIFGVIGILDCQEWKDKSFNESYEETMKEEYPTAVVTRCFAFDPTENQADNANGLIMIPNIGNMAFYMSTMMNDFANEMLAQFSILASRIQSLEILESPISTTQTFSRVRQRSSSANAEDLKKKTPGRIKKLLGDFYLLAGRLPDAIRQFEQAIDMGRLTNDFLWLASAIEGRICTIILLEYIQMDIGHITTRASENSQNENQGVSTISSITEQYGIVASNYARMRFTGSFPNLVYIECCIRISRLLVTAYLNQGWNKTTMELLIQRKLSNNESVDKLKLRHPITKSIPRSIIGQWITKVFEANITEMSLLNQVHMTMSISSLYSCIGYRRKSAWLMYRSIEIMLPLLVQHHRAHLSKMATGQDIGVLYLLRQVSEVYGVSECNVYDDNILDENKNDSETTTSSSSVRGMSTASKNILFWGWPLLQVDVLKQCISVSEALLDNKSQLYYTAILLKALYQHISKHDQIRLATSIQAMVATKNTNKTVSGTESMINYWGVNIISNIRPKNPIPRREIHAQYVHCKNDKDTGEILEDPFIYNPFALKKAKDDILLVKDELCEFKVTLVNPFGFCLELRNIKLSTSGVDFHSVPTAISIPANATVTVTLAGTPNEKGLLVVRGCMVQIIGFLEQEFLFEPGNKECLDEKVVKIKRSGLDAVQCKYRRDFNEKSAGELKQENFLSIDIVDVQPLLKIKNTSLLHNAIMLYEGEVTHIIIEIENIGNTPVDFIKLSFTESTTVQYSPFNHNLSSEDQYEFELNAKKVHVFSWEADSSTKNPVDPTDMFYLSPGGTGTVSIKVYGKRDCCGGSIQIDYGYLNRNNHAENQNRIKTAFYTRQLYINILLTVYQNLKPSNWDVVYIRHATRYSTNIEACITEDDLKIHQRGEIKEPGSPVRYLMDAATDMIIGGHSKSYYCFISLDITNTWTTSFDITFSVSNKECENILSNITIQPGCTKRVLLPIKKLFLPLDICLRDIPSVDSNQQFVKSQEPEEQHTKRRQIFWYREELLKRIECFWYCRVTGRKGTINLRPFVKLTENQLAVIKKENVEFSINVHGHSARKIGRRLFECFNNEQITIDVTIRNRLLHPARLILRIQPVQGYANSKQECQFSEDVLIEGMHQVLLKEVPAENGQMTCSFPLYFLSSGRFELLYHAEDLNTRNVYYDHEWIVFNVLEPSVKMKKDPS